MNSLSRLVLSAFGGLLLLPAAGAYTIGGYKWSSSPKLLIYPTDVTTHPNEWAVIKQVAARLQQNASTIGFSVGVDDSDSVGPDNAESEILFTDWSTWICGSDACCWAQVSGTQITEADVFFRSSTTWETSYVKSDNLAYGGAKRPIATAAMHEFGHALGLDHVNNLYSMMGSDWNVVTANGNTYSVRLGEDSTSGLRALYGSTSSGYEDLAVSNFMYDGVSGVYSTHKRVPLYDSSGGVATNIGTTKEPIYKMTKGTSFYLVSTLENNGANSQTPNARVYLSTDSTITTADTLLYSASQNLQPNTPTVAVYYSTLSSTLTSGNTYYLGVLLDATNTVAEIDETNNAAYITAIRIN